MLRTHRRVADRHRVRLATLVLTACLLSLLTCTSQAGPLTVGGGYDYYSGPADQTTRSAIGVVGVALGLAGSASLIGMRYDDTHAGEGWGLTAGVGVPVLPELILRAFGTRFEGDESFRAWRLKVGPQLGLPAGQSLSAYYSHYDEEGGAKSDGISAELAMPLVERLTGRATASYATSEGLGSGQGSIGLSWTPLHALELSGDVGLASGGASATQPFPSRRARLPLIGGDPPPSESPSSESTTETTVLAGIRVWFP